ncbi:MAG: hypothetical protein ICV73_13470 [Acetobacteraceae bacterium]|nr:hypothetical protein [Acetobacteraceae bacterium]
MRVGISIDPRDTHRDWVRDEAEFWLGNRARSNWRVREKSDSNGRAVLVFEFSDPLDAMDLSVRTVAPEHRGRLV